MIIAVVIVMIIVVVAVIIVMIIASCRRRRRDHHHGHYDRRRGTARQKCSRCPSKKHQNGPSPRSWISLACGFLMQDPYLAEILYLLRRGAHPRRDVSSSS